MNLENRLRELGDQILKLTEHNQLKTEIAMVSLKSIHQLLVKKNNEDEKGKYVIDKDSNLIFIDKIDGELSIYVKAGTHSKINVLKDMKLTNEGMKRSAITIEPTGILDIFVANGATLEVNSGFSTQGATGNMGQMKQNEGGKGAYAGINVPEGAEVNISGQGTVVAYGGNASAGGAGTSNTEGMSSSGNGGGRRRRSRCWNRWKWRQWWRI